MALQPDPDTPPIRYEIRRTYTPLGQPESVHLVSADGETLSLDHKVGYSWNVHGQLSGVTSLAGEFTYEYDPTNPALLTKMTGPAHIVETTYEPHRNLIAGVINRAKSSTGIQPGPPSVVARSGASEPEPAAPTLQDPVAQTAERIISSYSYANDVLGRRETISQGGEAFALLKLGDTKIDVAYNDRSEVVGAVYKTGNETRQQFSYAYDGIGNRRSFASELRSRNSEIRREEVSYTTNALNQYQEISADQRRLAVQYDLDGNLVEDDKNRYSWDSENRLVRVESKDGDLRIDYVYDHQSRRTLRTEIKRPGEENEERKTTYFLYDAWNLLAEYSRGTGGWIDEAPASPEGSESRAGDGDQLEAMNYKDLDSVRYHTWGRDLSGSLQGAGGVGGLLAISEGEAHRFPAYDANGNVSQLLNGSSEIAAAYLYDPFGNVTSMTGPEAESNPWRFSTKPIDGGTGWLYYGYRWLDPVTGRWPSRDPIGERGGVNLYGFVRNEPVRLYDSLGLEEKGIVVTIIPGLYHDPDSGEPHPDDDEADMREAFERYNLSQVITVQDIKDANSQLKKCKECIKVLHIEGHGNIGLQVIGSTLNPNKATEGYLSREVRNGEVILKGFDLFKDVRFCTDQKCKIIFHGCYVGKGISGMDFLQQVATDTKCYAYGWSKLCNRGRPYSHPHGNLQPDTVMSPK